MRTNLLLLLLHWRRYRLSRYASISNDNSEDENDDDHNILYDRLKVIDKWVWTILACPKTGAGGGTNLIKEGFLHHTLTQTQIAQNTTCVCVFVYLGLLHL